MKNRRASYLLKSAVLILVYVPLAIVSLRLSAVSGYVALVWPPAGIALAAILILGMEYWPALVIATVLISVFSAMPFLLNVPAAAGSTIEPLIGAYLLKKVANFDSAIERVGDVLSLLIYAALISTLIGATVGVTGLYLVGAIHASAYPRTWFAWWVGDVLGVLVVAPFLLVWSRRPLLIFSFKKVLLALVTAVILVFLSVIVFHGIQSIDLHPFTIEYLLFPILIWIALRYGQRGSVTATLVVSTVAIWAALSGADSAIHAEFKNSLLYAQVFMACLSVTFMTMGAIVAEQARAQERQLTLVARTTRLSQQRAKLIALNAAKDEFISVASHQLRTPATAVKQYLGMLLHNYAGKLTAAQHHMLTIAYENNERQLRATNDLLNVAQIDSGNVNLFKEPVDLKLLIADVVQGQTADIEAREQTCKCSYRTNSKYVVYADKTKIGMVLENLVSNASKYSHPGKHISIKISKTPQTVSVAVTDQGVGMTKADLGKLFKKFTRLDNTLSVSVGGMGLGLYWAKRMLDLHGGTIAATSVLGQGTTFTITLPTTKADNA